MDLQSEFQTREGSTRLGQVSSSLKEGERKQTQGTERGSSVMAPFASPVSLPRPRSLSFPHDVVSSNVRGETALCSDGPAVDAPRLALQRPVGTLVGAQHVSCTG